MHLVIFDLQAPTLAGPPWTNLGAGTSSINVTPCHFYSILVFPTYRVLYSIIIGSIKT